MLPRHHLYQMYPHHPHLSIFLVSGVHGHPHLRLGDHRPLAGLSGAGSSHRMPAGIGHSADRTDLRPLPAPGALAGARSGPAPRPRLLPQPGHRTYARPRLGRHCPPHAASLPLSATFISTSRRLMVLAPGPGREPTLRLAPDPAACGGKPRAPTTQPRAPSPRCTRTQSPTRGCHGAKRPPEWQLHDGRRCAQHHRHDLALFDARVAGSGKATCWTRSGA